MFEDRGPAIFPHAASAWWIPILLAIGWGALFLVDLFQLEPPGEDGWTLAIGMGITLPCTLAAAFSVSVQIFRLLMYFLNQPRSVDEVNRRSDEWKTSR
jgi:hypothetical protein